MNTVQAIQQKVGVEADGVIGPVTIEAIARALGIAEDASAEEGPIPPQSRVRLGKSLYGSPGCEENLVNVTPPYPLLYEGKPVKSIRVHRCIAARVERALRAVLEHYGQEAISRLGLDLYGGSYNYRSCTGGSSLSMHAWGVALDFDPEHNSYNMKRPRARFSGAEYEDWWRIWEEQGAISLGRQRDVDWMHLQFATLD